MFGGEGFEVGLHGLGVVEGGGGGAKELLLCGGGRGLLGVTDGVLAQGVVDVCAFYWDVEVHVAVFRDEFAHYLLHYAALEYLVYAWPL